MSSLGLCVSSKAARAWLAVLVSSSLIGIGCGGSSGNPTDGAVDRVKDGGGSGGADARGSGGSGGGTGGGFGSGGASGTGGGFGSGGASGTGGASVDAPVDHADATLDMPAMDAVKPVDVSVDHGPDLAMDTTVPKDVAADVPRDVPVDMPPRCAAGAACTLRGAPAICKANACAACVDTTDDGACVTAYGAAHVCVRARCISGDCHTSATCTAGEICGARTANTCGACTSDAQCRNDTRYGSAFVCFTTPGQANTGKCVAAMCTGAGVACGANSSDVCCNASCVTGNCCTDDDCRNNPKFGAGFACGTNHTCSRCDGVTGNHYFVDPAGGNDSTATGSGQSANAAVPSCSFKTITRALQIIGNNAPVGTTVTVVGKTGATTSLQTAAGPAGSPAPEDLPITVGTNVKITTSGGAISLVLPAGADGFKLAGNGASLTPTATAALIIDGSTSTSGSGIVVAPGAAGTVSISDLTVQNTGDDGITISEGTLNIGAGVVVKGVGLPSETGRRSGLNVAGGTVKIAVPNGQTQTSFNANTENGIRVTVLGTLTINGVATGEGTVVAKSNTLANIFINHTPGAAPAVSSIDGVIATGSTNGDGGFQILGGSRVKLRNSMVLGNAKAGVAIGAADATAAGSALAGIDLGTAQDPGRNVLQAALGSNSNTGAGLCVQLDADAGNQTLAAAGNTFAGPRDCAAVAPGAITKGMDCGARVDEAVVPATGTTVTVTISNCQ